MKEMKDLEPTSCQRKPTKLRNLIHKTEAFDILHTKYAEVKESVQKMFF